MLYEGNGDIVQSSDWLAVVNGEYKPGTDDKFMTINVLKRRRIDASEAENVDFLTKHAATLKTVVSTYDAGFFTYTGKSVSEEM